jgi:formate hydrogenlyase subunit 4
MLIGVRAEPALLMVLFTISLIASSTSLATIASYLAGKELTILPSMAFAGINSAYDPAVFEGRLTVMVANLALAK